MMQQQYNGILKPIPTQPRPELPVLQTVNKTDQLYDVCKKFIEDQKISGGEFIEQICDVVGYYVYPED